MGRFDDDPFKIGLSISLNWVGPTVHIAHQLGLVDTNTAARSFSCTKAAAALLREEFE